MKSTMVKLVSILGLMLAILYFGWLVIIVASIFMGSEPFLDTFPEKLFWLLLCVVFILLGSGSKGSKLVQLAIWGSIVGFVIVVALRVYFGQTDKTAIGLFFGIAITFVCAAPFGRGAINCLRRVAGPKSADCS